MAISGEAEGVLSFSFVENSIFSDLTTYYYILSDFTTHYEGVLSLSFVKTR